MSPIVHGARSKTTQTLYTVSLHSLFTQTLKNSLSPSNTGTGATRDLSLCGVRRPAAGPSAVKKGTQQALVPFAAAATVPLVVNHVHVSHESE